MQRWWWTKLGLEVIKKAKKLHLLCINGTLYIANSDVISKRKSSNQRRRKTYKTTLVKMLKKINPKNSRLHGT